MDALLRKPKEPLVAGLLSCICPGMGHIYTGNIKKAIILFVFPLLLTQQLARYFFRPETKIFVEFLWFLPVYFFLSLYIVLDAYFCAKRFNQENNLLRKITSLKKFILMGCIVLYSFYPFVNKWISFYIKNNFCSSFSYSFSSDAAYITTRRSTLSK